jgi:hypothetical protein
MTGKALAKPDFALLRAELTAAQAATPTAAASGKARAHVRPTEALTRVFGDQVTDQVGFTALHGSFNPASVQEEGGKGEEK